MDIRLTRQAERDLLAIMAWSRREFGRDAQLRYEALLDAAMRDLAANPRRPGARQPEDTAEGVGLYHLRHSRLRAPRTELNQWIGKGENEAISLALELPGATLLVDDILPH